MQRSRTGQVDPATDYDSFLDIVANLVGILVILIMVIGVRAQDAWESRLQDSPSTAVATTDVASSLHIKPSKTVAVEASQAHTTLPDLTSHRQEVLELQTDTLRLDEEVKKIEYESEIQSVRRDRLQLLVTSVQRKLGKHREQLADKEREQVDKQLLIAERRRNLNLLNENIQNVSNAKPQPEVLKHYPTPLAKTVFGREDHFRLRGGQLVHVPINEIMEQLGSDARGNAWKLKDTPRVTETFGPLAGFFVKYTLVALNQRVPTENGYVMRQAVKLDRFVLVPSSGLRETSLHQALANNSDFRRRLAQLNPTETTITVWTYPDSYAELRKLKDELLKLGFLTATRPLPAGYPIGGSPRGTKSAAQ